MWLRKVNRVCVGAVLAQRHLASNQVRVMCCLILLTAMTLKAEHYIDCHIFFHRRLTYILFIAADLFTVQHISLWRSQLCRRMSYLAGLLGRDEIRNFMHLRMRMRT